MEYVSHIVWTETCAAYNLVWDMWIIRLMSHTIWNFFIRVTQFGLWHVSNIILTETSGSHNLGCNMSVTKFWWIMSFTQLLLKHVSYIIFTQTNVSPLFWAGIEFGMKHVSQIIWDGTRDLDNLGWNMWVTEIGLKRVGHTIRHVSHIIKSGNGEPHILGI